MSKQKKPKDKLSDEVVRRILNGDDEALCVLVAHYKNLAISICELIAESYGEDLMETEIEDIVQKVNIKLITKQLKTFTRID